MPADPKDRLFFGVRNETQVYFYFDGFNLYHGIKASGDKTLLWLDVVSLCKTMIRKQERIHHIHYFTAIPKLPSDKVRRHKNFLKLLKCLDSDIRIHLGRFILKPVNCEADCGQTFMKREEKMSDVAMGCQIVHDAHIKDCENMYLVTGDADLLPAIRLIKQSFPKIKIEILFPPNRESKILKFTSKELITYKDHMSEYTLAKYRLPEEFLCPDGTTLKMPNEWIVKSRIHF